MIKRNLYLLAIITQLCLFNIINGSEFATESLDENTLELFHSMGIEGQLLFYQLAKQECRGQNICKGLNSCKKEGVNDCAGLGMCRGTCEAPFDDKNVAVKVILKQMAEKRMELSFEPLSTETNSKE